MRIAVLDLYKGVPNQGMKGIRKILEDYIDPIDQTKIDYHVFDVRNEAQIPNLDFDAYISSGGPGNPDFTYEENGSTWGPLWQNWIGTIIDYNKNHDRKKFVFLICHSFQMMCLKTGAAKVELRHSPSFGIFPMHKTSDGKQELLFNKLLDPFYAVDSRTYQVLDPNSDFLEKKEIQILAYEKIRPHVPLDRAIMAIRFSTEIIGTQFHPEADPAQMKSFFALTEKKEEIIREHGVEKYEGMLESLDHPDRISRTFSSLIPDFLNQVSHSKLIQSIA